MSDSQRFPVAAHVLAYLAHKDAFSAPNAVSSACLAASIFHYREHTIGEAKQYLKEKGVPVRL